MRYVRMPIEIESPEQMGYDNVKFNLTESSFRDAVLGDLDLDLSKLVLCYGDHLGLKPLRELLAKEYGVKADDVLLTVGAAHALFLISTSFLEKGDRLLVERPNYATNIETPRAIGAAIDFYELTFEDGYRLDVEKFAAMIRPETKLVSVTTPHNPTGVVLPEADLRKLVEITGKKGVTLLVDETYRDMAFGKPTPFAATLGRHVISVCSLSKTYGLPGIRLGWLVSTDPKRMETLLAAKEQSVIAGSVVDETIALEYLKTRAKHFPAIQAKIREHHRILEAFYAEEKRLERVPTEGGVVSFPRIRKDAGVDVEKFYECLNGKYRTFVGPGHWFEQERRSMRIGFGWPTTEELRGGLANLSKALGEAKA
ncbi:MAG: pyridoxal phosphate-dependent aminotransferase [Bdellovibrionales bacterium]|nr:pyridoxal phosphate-dependent aminotransferase [Bdellovibrionales bacterium]